jgi:serine/threonine-protein kinase
VADSGKKGLIAIAPKPPRPVAVPQQLDSRDLVPVVHEPPSVTADTAIINAVGRAGDNKAAIHAVPTVGDRIGKYVVDRIIGSGGMGLVLAARHEALEELVAIKLLRPKAAGDKIHAERFAREARSMIKIKSEHVVRVLDAGTLESGAPYIVMEYLIGRDLSQILRSEGPLHYQRAADLMLQVCEAVASAHAVGVIHRDLKPSNFFVTQRADGTTLVKVLDFGISKAIGTDGVIDPTLTETQAVFGSPTYMSPEQIRSAKHVDHRSDIWSLGVGLYEMVTGRLPFEADNVAGLLASIVADPPFYPRGFIPDLPEELEQLLLALLAKDPNQRIQTVADFAFRLAAFATPSVETRTLVERIARLADRAVPAPHAVTTGPKLPAPSGASPPSAPNAAPSSSPSITSVPLIPIPPHPFAAGHSSGSTGTDLSAEAPVRRGSTLAAVGVGLGVAALILVGFGVSQVRSSSVRTPEPAVAATTIATSIGEPASATTEPPASAAATVTVTTPQAFPPTLPALTETAGPATTATAKATTTKKKLPKPSSTGATANGASTAKPVVDPTNDRY